MFGKLVVIIFLVFGAWQIRSIFGDKWYASHDGIYHVVRTEQFDKMLKLGFFPVRWGLDLNSSYGVPIFNYVYPGPYYLTSIFRAIGLNATESLKIVMLIFYGLGGVGVFLIAKEKLNLINSLMVGMIYMLVPYQFVDLLVRGAVGEVLALGLMPLAWWAFGKEKGWWRPLPLALLLVCHNFLGFLFLGFLTGWGWLNGQINKQKLLIILGALGLSAFFWLPAIAERGLIKSGQESEITFRYDEHFSSLKQLIYSPWGYWYSNAGTKDDGMSFQVGLAGLVAGIMALWQARKSRSARWLVIFFGMAIFMMLPISSWVWKSFKFIQMIQFPWRWLFLTTFLTPLLIIEVAKNYRKIGGGIIILLLMLAWINSRNYKNPLHLINEVDLAERFRLASTGTTTVDRSEIITSWAKQQERRAEVEVAGGGRHVVGDMPAMKKFEMEINLDKSEILQFNRSYFPSWRLWVDDKAASFWPSGNGAILFDGLTGRHKYKFELGETVLERLADWITVMTAVIILGAGRGSFFRRSGRL